MEANEILKKAMAIVQQAQELDGNFHSDYGYALRATGESSADYSLYEIELSDEYYLVIDFVDFSMEDFSIVCRTLEHHIARNVEEDTEN